jgi:DNA-binding PadR family transcriptional regulator
MLVDEPRRGYSGAEIAKETGIGSGTLYPLLARFEAAGLVTGKWEVADPASLGRPRRRFYKLTAAGYKVAQKSLAELQIPTGELAWTS